MKLQALVWLTGEDGEAWVEHEAGELDVLRTDENEVYLGVKLHNETDAAASLYLTLAEASRLAHLLGVAILAHEAAAHEAANYERGTKT